MGHFRHDICLVFGSVDGSEIQFPTTWNVENPVNNGILWIFMDIYGYLPYQQVQDVFHQQYHLSLHEVSLEAKQTGRCWWKGGRIGMGCLEWFWICILYMYTMGTQVPFFFRGYNPYIGGLKPSFFMVLGSKGSRYIYLSKSKSTKFCQTILDIYCIYQIEW